MLVTSNVVRFRQLAIVAAVGFLSCAQSLPDHAKVLRVIDGDTIELADGRLVRYIGIDTPEFRRREGSRWVVDPEPFSREAMQANQRLVGGKTVRLEYDVEIADRHGRLLAYVYVDGTMVNAKLLEEGYAHLLTIPPDVKYAARFRQVAQDARTHKRGLWAAR